MVDPACQGRFLHDIPGEKPFVKIDPGAVGTGGPHQEFEPPVWGVEDVTRVLSHLIFSQSIDFLVKVQFKSIVLRL